MTLASMISRAHNEHDFYHKIDVGWRLPQGVWLGGASESSERSKRRQLYYKMWGHLQGPCHLGSKYDAWYIALA